MQSSRRICHNPFYEIVDRSEAVLSSPPWRLHLRGVSHSLVHGLCTCCAVYSIVNVRMKEENLSFLLTLTKRAKNRRFKRNFIKNKSLNVHCNKQAPLCCLTVRNADREPVNMRKSMGWTVSRDSVIIRADMRLKCQVQTWCFDRCLSPVRKVSGTMDFAEICVTRLEQELCTQNFFFHSLSWWSIMRYEKVRI